MKKYVITGSVGHISKPVIAGLVKAGKEVKVITSSPDRVRDIEALGAVALVGGVQDASFLKEAFRGADVVYTMIPPIWQTDNWRAAQTEVATNYAEAVRVNKVKYVVNLSSMGAHVNHDLGPVNALHDFEQMLNNVPGLHVRHLRPAYFYYNFISQIGLIKQAGFMGANYGNENMFLVHPNDIAHVALEDLLALNFSGNSVRYIISDERSGKEIASVLGKSIGKDLNWVLFTDDQQKQGLLQAGLPETHAHSFAEMGKGLREGLMQSDVRRHELSLSPTKLEDFAHEFAGAYQSQK
jgi:uncharacterized protein YbjT (DUF2867 family)